MKNKELEAMREAMEALEKVQKETADFVIQQNEKISAVKDTLRDMKNHLHMRRLPGFSELYVVPAEDLKEYHQEEAKLQKLREEREAIRSSARGCEEVHNLFFACQAAEEVIEKRLKEAVYTAIIAADTVIRDALAEYEKDIEAVRYANQVTGAEIRMDGERQLATFYDISDVYRKTKNLSETDAYKDAMEWKAAGGAKG